MLRALRRADALGRSRPAASARAPCPSFSSAWAAVAHRGAGAVLVRRWKDGGLDLADVAARVIEERRVPPDVDCLCAGAREPGARAAPRRRRAAGARARARRALGAPAAARPDPARAATRRPSAGSTSARAGVNLRGVVRAATARAPLRVALIDDVYTTGATADACARALRAGGAEHVDVLAFARALRD